MQPVSTSIWLIAFVAINGVFSQVPFPGKCPDVSIMDTFDLDAYMGIWYEHSKYPFAFEIGKKCIYANYNQIDNSTISVVNGAINRFTGNPTNVTGTAKVIAPGQLAVVFSENQKSNNANYLVLGSDYTSYSVVYSCTSLTPWAHLKVVWILTREREAATDTVKKALQILDANKISQAVLIETTQKNCPDLGVNGTMSSAMQLNEDDFANNALPEAVEKA